MTSVAIHTMARMELPQCYALREEAWLLSRGRPDGSGKNEDVAAIVDGSDGTTLVIADGVGGSTNGQRAANETVCLVARAAAKADAEGLRSAIVDAIEDAHQRIRTIGQTTLTIVTIRGSELRTYQVGDSAAFVIGQRGKLRHKTTSHSPVGYAVESGVIDHREALVHEELHLVSNVLGAGDMNLELSSNRALRARDTVLVASDGLLDNVYLDEIIEIVRAGPLGDAARKLTQRSIERMARTDRSPSKPDDLSFIVFRRGRGGARAQGANGSANDPGSAV